VSATHRKEWVDFKNAPEFSTIGFQLPVLRRFTKTSFGALMTQDKVGPLSSVGVNGTYTYKIRPGWFGKKYGGLTLGLGAGAKQVRYRPDKVTTFEPIEGDPAALRRPSTRFTPSVSVGAFYNSVSDFYSFKSHYYFGLAIQNLAPFNEVKSVLGELTPSPHVYAHGGFRHFPFRKKYYFEPSVMVSYSFTRPILMMANLRYEKVDQYWIAGGAASDGEVFAQAGFIFTEDSFLEKILNGGVIRLGFKVDYALGSIRKFAGTGYEMYAAYIFELD
jgi:type IX secretion system PorP/SprF family membrane protein